MPDSGEQGTDTAADRAGGLATGLAVAAALAAWNPLAAPFGLVVGVGALVVALRGLRGRRGSRALGLLAAVVACCAALGSAVVLLRTAGAVTGELGGEPVVEGRSREEVLRILDGAADESGAARRRASEELGRASAPERPDRPPPEKRPKSGMLRDGERAAPSAPRTEPE